MDWFETAGVTMDGECLSQDFDDVDLYGERKVEDSQEELDIDMGFK